MKKFYKIPDENCYCIGDEIDIFHGGMYPKTPEATHTPLGELQDSINILQEWYKCFPVLKLCLSNHGTRWIRKAVAAEIPSQMLRRYEEMIQAPPTWKWQKYWKVNSKHPFIVEHGDDYGGRTPHVNAASANGTSTVIGHHHSISGLEHIKTNGMEIWGMCVGSMIDFEQYAFNYARTAKYKPIFSLGVVFSDGKMPAIIK